MQRFIARSPMVVGEALSPATYDIRGMPGTRSRSLDKDLEALCKKAIEYGAQNAKLIPANKVVLDPRVRMKCSIPLCASYNNNLMCPPYVIDPEDFKEALSRYKHALVVQFFIDIKESEIKMKFKSKQLQDLVQSDVYLDAMRKHALKMEELLGKLEKDALYMGYRFATALAGGSCKLCDECVAVTGGKKCRHPFKARPSMEAVGIDVVATAENAGIPVEFPAAERPVWTGLLLVE